MRRSTSGSSRARDGAVHAVVVRRDAADGREGGLAARPEAQALRLVAWRCAPRWRRWPAAARAPAAICSDDLLLGAVQLAQQDGGGVGRVAGVDEVLRGADGGLSIISRPAGMMPAAMMSPTASPAFSTSSKAASTTCARSRLGQQLDRDLDHHAQHALGAGHQGQQVVARGVQRLAADARAARRPR